jgi:alpha-tubulin suppressor-like RCC1 family protein
VNGLVGNVVQLDTGDYHTCARLIPWFAGQTQLYCWGSDNEGQLGNGAITGAQPTPQLILTGWTLHAVGGNSTCGADGSSVMCWGSGSSGQLGTGGFTNYPSPTPSAGFSGTLMMDIGSDHACAIQAGGTVLCSGSSAYGQLGIGVLGYAVTPQDVVGFGGGDFLFQNGFD